ncbi:MAG: 50S ribosomal protein L3 [bacterium]|nr:50S ribosomal protein L3 [bacterium]MCP5068129.1 50S ribosomal protein L3 [bacterium]
MGSGLFGRGRHDPGFLLSFAAFGPGSPIVGSPAPFYSGSLKVAIELLCRKIGMTRVFSESGECIPVTVLEAGPNTVVQKKTPEKDGYSALQLGFGERRRVTLQKPRLGHYEKAGVAPKRYLKECRVSEQELDQFDVGAEIKADLFEAGQKVDAIGTSKGRGNAGVIKRFHFKIKRKTHGTHEGARRPGSIGAGAYPGKVIKGKPMYGQLGNAKVTTRNLEVVQVDTDKNLLLVRGGVPGHNNALVRLRPASAPKS